MSEVDEFLAAVMSPLKEADTALHNGDAGPRSALWSHDDPVTLFGASATKSGWAEVEGVFQWLASTFNACQSFDYEVIAAGASGDLGYIIGIEHTTASVNGSTFVPYQLRVTTIFRREGSVWKIVHRHGDTIPGSDSIGPGVGLYESAPSQGQGLRSSG